MKVTVEQRLARIEEQLKELREDHTRYMEPLLKMVEGWLEWWKVSSKED